MTLASTSNATPAGIDWTGVPEPMARQIFDQGQTFLQAQLTAALASDQRAMTLAGVMATVATAIFAGSIAYWDKSGSVPPLVAGVTTGAVMLVGACFGVWAARPIDFNFPGNQPENWYDSRSDDLAEALGGEAENINAHIETNNRTMEANQKALFRGVAFGVGAPVVGMIAWAISLSFPA